MSLRNSEVTSKTITFNALPLPTIGLIVFIILLILKLCNQNNPDFEWLTWFWVWFPLWLPFAIFGAIILLILIGYGIVLLVNHIIGE